MTWLIFTLVSSGVVLDVDHKQFKSYTECEKYVEQLRGDKIKSCFTNRAKFKKVKKNEHIRNVEQHRVTHKQLCQCNDFCGIIDDVISR